MDRVAQAFQRRMQRAVMDLHESSDALVDYLGAIRQPNDEEYAALEGARRWRSLVESGE